MLSRVRDLYRTLQKQNDYLQSLQKETEHQRFVCGQMLSRQLLERKEIKSIRDAEFQVFSQYGDDGIIQFLISRLKVPDRTFIEFGVENYKECNTRFLLMNNYWRGLVIDSDEKNIESIKQEGISWRYSLTAVKQFVTRDNINRIFAENSFSGELELLSIDVDGNDYWIWEAIKTLTPHIVIVEYNSMFGIKYPITIPYQEKFHRTAANRSNLYYGTSLKALHLLALQKGYSFIGCNSAGNNAYFIRRDKIELLAPISAVALEEGYVKAVFRECRDEQGRLTFLSEELRLDLIKDMPVWDVEREKTYTIKELFLAH